MRISIAVIVSSVGLGRLEKVDLLAPLRSDGATSPTLRNELAVKAFTHTADYDTSISGLWFAWCQAPSAFFPASLWLREMGCRFSYVFPLVTRLRGGFL